MTLLTVPAKDLKRWTLFLLILSIGMFSFGQVTRVDSLSSLLNREKADSNRVKLLWQLAEQVNIYNPDTGLRLAQEALYLAKKINYSEGQSRSLGILSNTFIKLSNFPKALELNIQKLKLDEKRGNQRNLASVLMNIAVIYTMQEEYEKALLYYKQSDSVIRLHHIKDLEYYIDLNLGDVYNRLNQFDSAHLYFNRSLAIAKELKEDDFIGTSMTGLGHSFLKLGQPDSSLYNYSTGIAYLRSVNDDEILTEAALGLANLYRQTRQYDSSKFYASLSYSIAKKAGFLLKELEAAEFLTAHFKFANNTDSAFVYINQVIALNDSINSRNRIRESQMITSNEQFRQNEIEENNRLAKKERKQRLQLLFIGIFIPGLFLFTLFLSRVKVPIKLIRVLGILSLLFFFEYTTILLHPFVANLTNHTPWIEILIFVAIGAILVPTHHRLEHWLIETLMKHRKKQDKQPVISPEVLNEETAIELTMNGEENLSRPEEDNEILIEVVAVNDSEEPVTKEEDPGEISVLK